MKRTVGISCFKAVTLFFALFVPWSGRSLPVDGLTDMNGQPASFEHKKNRELILFWATTCVECKAKLQDVLPKINAREEVAVATINTDRDRERAKHFMEKNKIQLPVFQNKVLQKALKVYSVPHWVVYGRKSVKDPWVEVASAPAFDLAAIETALGSKP
jgi:hypothetical protein